MATDAYIGLRFRAISDWCGSRGVYAAGWPNFHVATYQDPLRTVYGHFLLHDAVVDWSDVPASVYWSNGIPGHKIGRAALDGSGVNQSLITGTTNVIDPGGLAVEPSHIFWTNASEGSIGRANLDGSQPERDFIPDATGPHGSGGDQYDFLGLAVDGLYTVDTTPPDTELNAICPPRYEAPCPSTDKTHRKFNFRSSEPNSTFECKLDKKKWKACKPHHKYQGLKQGKHKFSVRAIDAAGRSIAARRGTGSRSSAER